MRLKLTRHKITDWSMVATLLSVSPLWAATTSTVPTAAPGTKPSASSKPAGPFAYPAVVVTVNGKPLTRAEVDGELERNYGDQIVFQLILNRLLDEEASKLKIVPSAAKVASSYSETDMQTGGRLESLLEQHHMTRADFEQHILKPRLEMEALSQRDISVSDADIATYFEEHKEQWSTPEKVELYRIHTPDEKTAKEAKAALDAKTSWSDVLKKYSDDKAYYKDHDGFYGALPRASLTTGIQQAINNLKAGDVSAPVADETPGGMGFIIWRLAAIDPAKPAVLAEHKEEIRKQLVNMKAKPNTDIIKGLLKSAKLSGVPSGVQKMIEQMETAPPMRGPGMPPPPPAGPGGAPRVIPVPPVGAPHGVPPPPPVPHP